MFVGIGYLSKIEQIKRMIFITESNKPAMEAVIESIEVLFPRCEDFDLLMIYQHRQKVGSMIRFIMGHYGYRLRPAKLFKKGSFVKTAIVFKKI